VGYTEAHRIGTHRLTPVTTGNYPMTGLPLKRLNDKSCATGDQTGLPTGTAQRPT